MLFCSVNYSNRNILLMLTAWLAGPSQRHNFWYFDWDFIF